MRRHQVIFGPPGCGKTHDLVEKVDEFLRSSTGRALFTSHTRAAAATAVGRIGENSRVDISTLHSFCFKELKLSRNQTVDDQKIEELFTEFGLDFDEGGDGRRYQEVMSYAICTGKSMMDAYERSGSPGTKGHFEAFEKSYRAWKLSGGFLDFNDMLLKYLTHKRASGHLLLALDEAQDMTPLHWKVVRQFMLLNPQCQVVVAGDDDQCVYSYAGADPHGMAEFAETFPSDTTTLTLSHRVPVAVHRVAQAITARMSRRVDKIYKPRDAAGYVSDSGDFRWINGDLLDDSLILFNDKFIREEVEEELKDAAVPYVAVSGMPAPLQQRGAKAVRTCFIDRALTTEESDTVRRGLNEKGVAIFNSIGPQAIIDKVRRGDHSLINFGNTMWINGDYYGRVDWSKEPKIRISTIHGAKGMEAEHVFLLLGQSQAAVEYSFRDPDAQHRLMYVGATRAKVGLSTFEGENSYDFPRD